MTATRIGNATGITMRGPTEAEASFSASSVPRDHVISSGGSSEQTVDDAVFDVHTTATVDREANIIGIEANPGVFDPYLRFESLDPSIATVDSAGRVTRAADGTARILAKTRLAAPRRVSVTVLRETGQTTSVFSRFDEGTLARAIADGVDLRIAEKNPTTTKPIFSQQNHVDAVYERNADCWASGLNLACISPYNSSHGVKFCATPVTPRHVLMANHAPVSGTLRFVDADNNVIERTITSAQSISGASLSKDVKVGLLNSALPESIGFARLLPANYADYLPDVSYGLPALGLSQFERASVHEIYSLSAGQVACHNPTTADRIDFQGAVIVNDSGNPLFVIIDDELVFVGMWTYTGWGSGTNLADYLSDIDTAITSLGGGYQLTTVDLSEFTDFS